MDDKTAAFARLQGIIDVLRGPNGCPWDRAQTLGNMGRYIEEEASEVLDAIFDSGGAPSPPVREELGDLLLTVLLSAKIAEDSGAFGFTQIAAWTADKLIRRHPHVFGDAKVAGVDDVLANWNAIKAEEKARAHPSVGPSSRLDGVPRSLSPLERAFELGRKAAKAGFDWQDPEGALAKVEEETAEVRQSLQADKSAMEGELGDLLFAVVNLCRKLEVPPGQALRHALKKFCERFQAIEKRLPDMERASLPEMEAAWDEAKRNGATGARP